MNLSKAKSRKHTAVAVFAAAFAMAAGGIALPAASHAEKVWDIGSYDSCVTAADNRFLDGKTDVATYTDEVRFCCDRSGGEWNSQAKKCEAPPATFQTQSPTKGSVVVPPTGKAALP